MTRKLIGRIFAISLYIFVIAIFVYGAVHDHIEILGLLGIIVGIQFISIVLSYLSGRGNSNFKKMMESLPADHKLVTDQIAAIDIGNYRFLYQVYVKSMGPAPKSYVLMEVGVPFPEEEVEKGEYTARESIKWDLQNLIDNLLEEGILTDYSPIVQENAETEDSEPEDGETTRITWLGQIMRLEFLRKSISAEKLAEVQGKILGIIDKYRLQDVSWCVICGRDYGSEYRYYKGNLLQSTVWSRGPLDRNRSDYKQFAQLYTGAYESLFSVDMYFDIYQMALRNLGRVDVKMSDVRKLAKQMFKGKKRMHVDVMEDTDEISVDLSGPGASSTYHLIHLEDRWWLYAVGRLDAFPPISLDDESSACDALLRYLHQHAD